MKFILLLSLVFCLLFSCADQEKKEPTEDLSSKIGNTYGVDDFDKVQKLSFTFNIQKDSFKTSRSWVWDVKNNIVSFNSPDTSVTYKRDTIQTVSMKQLDGMFINDQYWLMFPYHIMKDSGVTKTVVENVPGIMTSAPLTKMTIQYNNKDGYTPGDAYDVYVNDNNEITEWAYRKAGISTPSLATSWSEVKEFNGMKMATMFKNDSTKFQISFSGITVQ